MEECDNWSGADWPSPEPSIERENLRSFLAGEGKMTYLADFLD